MILWINCSLVIGARSDNSEVSRRGTLNYIKNARKYHTITKSGARLFSVLFVVC